MKTTFDVNVPRPVRRDRSAAGEAVAQLTSREEISPDQNPPIPITRARENQGPADAPPQTERRTDALRLELSAQLERAEEAEQRFLKALQKAQTDVVSLSEDVQAALRKMTHAEQQLRVKQGLLRQLLRRLSTLDKERETATRAREALEGLKAHYDDYYRTRAANWARGKTQSG